MANKTVSVDKFESAVKACLDDYLKVTDEGQDRAVKKTAMELKNKTRDRAPRKTGEYRSHFSQKETDKRFLHHSRTIYVTKPEYRLTHLLEHGHRGPHPAKAYPHFPQDGETEALLLQHLREEIEG